MVRFTKPWPRISTGSVTTWRTTSIATCDFRICSSSPDSCSPVWSSSRGWCSNPASGAATFVARRKPCARRASIAVIEGLNMMRILRLLLLLLASSSLAHAAPEKPAWPNALRDWVDWVKLGHENELCPLLVDENGGSDEKRVCAWPGQLVIVAGERGARFSQRWTVYAKSAVPLPGDADNWPQGVRVSAQAAPVVPDSEAHPVVWLDPGSYQIEGTISWARRPESVAVPMQ